jgi:hypothetical protein
MDKRDIVNMAKESQFIEGIYHYCDCWCERCPLKSRCLNYAITERNFGHVSIQDLHNKAFWEKLTELFQLTLNMLTDFAEQYGIELDETDTATLLAEEQRRVAAGRHDLTRAARRYSELVDQWFTCEHTLFAERQTDLNRVIQLGIDEQAAYAEADDINDAVEVIRWYQDQIGVKLMRALAQHEPADCDRDAGQQRDADGSAKVALIGMDRSIAAWITLRQYFRAYPDSADSILDQLVRLDRLRRRTEAVFPHARAFIRPGFDTLDLPPDAVATPQTTA